MADDLSPEAEVLATHMAATLGSLQVLAPCLQRSGALKEDEFPQALAEYMEAVKARAEPLTIELPGDLREALLN